MKRISRISLAAPLVCIVGALFATSSSFAQQGDATSGFAAPKADATTPAAPADNAKPSGKALTGKAGASAVTIDRGGAHQPMVLDRVPIKGKVAVPAPGKVVYLTVKAGSKRVLTRKLATNPTTGAYATSVQITSCCRYTAQATSGAARSSVLHFNARVPNNLHKGPVTKLFNSSLRKVGYHMGSISNHTDRSTQLGILAFRKVNKMARNTRYQPSIFKKLLAGDGGFTPQQKKKGRYVEVDISRQVMVFLRNGKVEDIFHVSTGKPSTPTVRGHFRFYRKQPGYNSLRMYYSVYFIRGYATHGYHDVPTFNASHGCVRNPERYSRYIYDWIHLGDPIYTYL